MAFFRWFRWAVLGGPLGVQEDTTPSAAQSSFAATEFAQPADDTPNPFLITVRNAAGTPLANKQGVVTASFATVDVDASTVEIVGSDEILDDDGATAQGVGNILVTLVDTLDRPMVGVALSAVSSRPGNDTVTVEDARTDHLGQAVITLTSDAAGDSVVTVSAAGVALTETADFTVSGDAPAQLTSVFQSDWTAALGTGSTARTDGGKWNTVFDGDDCEVIAATGLGFPATMANCLLVPWEATGQSRLLRVAGLSVPGVGDVRYYRWYQRIVIPDGTADTGTHPQQDGFSVPETNWFIGVENSGVPAGEWQPSMHAQASPYPYYGWYSTTNLDKDVSYRHEVRIEVLDASTFLMDIRIYDEAGVLVLTGADFVRVDGSDTLADEIPLTFEDIDNLDGFNCGCNDGTGTEEGDYAYQGGVAICDNQGWIGPYGTVDGEAT